MFHFENTIYFWGLGLIPLLLALYWAARWHTQRQRAAFGTQFALDRLVPNSAPYKRSLKLGLALAALTMLVIAMANPRAGSTLQSVQREGIDVFLVLDVSRSMWAEDVRPNRMERARQLAQKLIYERRGDRIGLILFAGYPYLQMPLTTDYAAARSFVQIASPQLDITQGTSVAEAIDLVAEISRHNEQASQRAVVVITDGENHEDRAPRAAALAKESGITTYVVGIGTEAGAPIPLRDNSRRTQFQLDKQGQLVQSKMNVSLMQALADEGGGTFYKANAQQDLVVARLSRDLDQLEKTRFEQQEFDTYETYYQYFLVVALGLLVVEFLVRERKGW